MQKQRIQQGGIKKPSFGNTSFLHPPVLPFGAVVVTITVLRLSLNLWLPGAPNRSETVIGHRRLAQCALRNGRKPEKYR